MGKEQSVKGEGDKEAPGEKMGNVKDGRQVHTALDERPQDSALPALGGNGEDRPGHSLLKKPPGFHGGVGPQVKAAHPRVPMALARPPAREDAEVEHCRDRSHCLAFNSALILVHSPYSPLPALLGHDLYRPPLPQPMLGPVSPSASPRSFLCALTSLPSTRLPLLLFRMPQKPLSLFRSIPSPSPVPHSPSFCPSDSLIPPFPSAPPFLSSCLIPTLAPSPPPPSLPGATDLRRAAAHRSSWASQTRSWG